MKNKIQKASESNGYNNEQKFKHHMKNFILKIVHNIMDMCIKEILRI